jgi:hypothetical protein
MQRAEVLHDLDMKYHQISHKTELLVKDEETRRMKLRSMVLADEAVSLKDKMSSRSARIKALTEQIDDARAQLQSAQEKYRRQEKLMQTQSREISNLKVGFALSQFALVDLTLCRRRCPTSAQLLKTPQSSCPRSSHSPGRWRS